MIGFVIGVIVLVAAIGVLILVVHASAKPLPENCDESSDDKNCAAFQTKVNKSHSELDNFTKHVMPEIAKQIKLKLMKLSSVFVLPSFITPAAAALTDEEYDTDSHIALVMNVKGIVKQGVDTKVVVTGLDGGGMSLSQYLVPDKLGEITYMAYATEHRFLDGEFVTACMHYSTFKKCDTTQVKKSAAYFQLDLDMCNLLSKSSGTAIRTYYASCQGGR
jgi:hypothetical protein